MLNDDWDNVTGNSPKDRILGIIETENINIYGEIKIYTPH